MVKLFPISQADFDAFLEREIIDYAADKVRSGNWRQEEAIERSRKEHEQLLPNGPRTKDHFIFSIFIIRVRSNPTPSLERLAHATQQRSPLMASPLQARVRCGDINATILYALLS